MKPSDNLENKTPSDTYWRAQLICKKVQTHSSLQPPLEYNVKHGTEHDVDSAGFCIN